MKKKTAAKAWAALTSFLLILVPGVPPAAAHHAGQLDYSGNAFGTAVMLGDTFTSGPTAVSALGSCGTPVSLGAHADAHLAAVDASPVPLRTGVVNTSVDAVDLGGGATATQSMAETYGVTILDGLVTADLVRAQAAVTHDGGGFSTSAAGGSVVNAKVRGLDVPVGPNTKVTLAGVGYVVFNEQQETVGSKRAVLTVTGIRVVVTEDGVVGAAAGSEILVSRARASVKTFTPVTAVLSGKAYGTLGRAGDTLRSDETALVKLECGGTDNQIVTNTVADVHVFDPPQVSVETVHTTAQGQVTSSLAEAHLTATTEGVNVLNGMITADVVKAQANVSTANTPMADAGGSEFVNLTVAGNVGIDDNVAANTKVRLLDASGVAFADVWLHRVIATETSVEVRMIEVVITSNANPFGLSLDTVLRVSVARAGVSIS